MSLWFIELRAPKNSSWHDFSTFRWLTSSKLLRWPTWLLTISREVPKVETWVEVTKWWGLRTQCHLFWMGRWAWQNLVVRWSMSDQSMELSRCNGVTFWGTVTFLYAQFGSHESSHSCFLCRLGPTKREKPIEAYFLSKDLTPQDRPDGTIPMVGQMVFRASRLSMVRLQRGTARTLVRHVFVVNTSPNPRRCMICKRSGHTQIFKQKS